MHRGSPPAMPSVRAVEVRSENSRDISTDDVRLLNLNVSLVEALTPSLRPGLRAALLQINSA